MPDESHINRDSKRVYLGIEKLPLAIVASEGFRLGSLKT